MGRSKQAEIPGTEPKRIKAVEEAVDLYVDARDKRMKLTEKEGETRGALEETMREHNLRRYRDPDGEFEVLLEERAKVHKIPTAKAE